MNITWIIYGVVLLSLFLGMCLLTGIDSSGRKIAADRWKRTRDAYGKKGFEIQMPLLTKVLEKNKRERMEGEIYEGMSFLRNILAVGEQGYGSSDFVIQQLSELPGQLQPLYIKMLRHLRVNQKEEALEVFAEKAGSDMGKDYARLLIQWDEMDPRKLGETISSYQSAMKEVRMTVQKRRDEFISDVIYLPVVTNVMLIFINFIYTAYFIDQREMLTMFL